MYKMLYTRFLGGRRLVTVFDFMGEQTIEFSLDELDKDELTKELKDYIKGIREDINSGYFDYSI